MAAILVIEDDEFFQNFLELVLSGEGHEIRIAADGDIGLEQASASPPDLILCDMSMPKMTGFEVIRELKSVMRSRTFPSLPCRPMTRPKIMTRLFPPGRRLTRPSRSKWTA